MVFSYTNIKQVEVLNSELGKNSFVNTFNPGQAVFAVGTGKKLRENYQKSQKSLRISPSGFTVSSLSSTGTDTTNNKFWIVSQDSGITGKAIVHKLSTTGTNEFAPIDVASNLSTSQANAPSGEVDQNGRFWFVYQTSGAALTLIGLNTDGTTYFAATNIATGLEQNSPGSTSLAIDKVNGRIWVAYQKSVDRDVYLQGRNTDGTVYFAETNIDSRTFVLGITIGISNTNMLIFLAESAGAGFRFIINNLDGTFVTNGTSGSVSANHISCLTLSNNETWVFYEQTGPNTRYQVYSASGSQVKGDTAAATNQGGSVLFKMKPGETPAGHLIFGENVYNKTTRIFSNILSTSLDVSNAFRHSSGQTTLINDGSQLYFFRQDLGFETGLTTNMETATFSSAPKTITLVGVKTTPTNTTLTADVQAFDSGKEVISNSSGLEEITNVVRDSTGNYFGIGKISSTQYLVKWDSDLVFSTKTSIGAGDNHTVLTTDGTHAYIVGFTGTSIVLRKHLLSNTTLVSTNNFTVTGATGNLNIISSSNAVNFGGNFYFSCEDSATDKKAFLVSVTTANALTKNWEKSQTAGSRDYNSRGVTTDGTDLFHLVEDQNSTTNQDLKTRIFKVTSAGADSANALLTDTNSLEKQSKSIGRIGTDIYVTGFHRKDTSRWFFAKLPTTLASETFNTEQDPVTQGTAL